LAMHEATLDLEWLAKAEKIADTLVSSFWDSHETRLYDTPNDGDDLIIRPSESYDNATPSGSSMTAEALFKLSLITNNSEYLNIFISLMKSTAIIASEHPVSFGNWLCVYDSYIYPTIEIAIIADDPKHALKMRDCLYESYIPNHIFCGNAYFSYTEKARNKWDTYPLLNDREPKTDIAMAYLCENYVCELPVSSTTELLQLIRQKTKVS
nr:hypothetical protein [Dehalococcoidia bacterium]